MMHDARINRVESLDRLLPVVAGGSSSRIGQRRFQFLHLCNEASVRGGTCELLSTFRRSQQRDAGLELRSLSGPDAVEWPGRPESGGLPGLTRVAPVFWGFALVIDRLRDPSGDV